MKSKYISKRTSQELAKDYHAISKIETEYYKLLKKYDPDMDWEHDEVLTAIVLELGERALRFYK